MKSLLWRGQLLLLAGMTACSLAGTQPSPAPSLAGTPSGGDACHAGGDTYCAVNAYVTDGDKSRTICATGWNQSERKRGDGIVHYATLKRKLLDQLHAQGQHLDWTEQNTELDHRMPISLGGSVTDLKNLSLEYDYGRKDDAETQLWDKVCHHGMALEPARAQLAHDWLGPFPTYRA